MLPVSTLSSLLVLIFQHVARNQPAGNPATDKSFGSSSFVLILWITNRSDRSSEMIEEPQSHAEEEEMDEARLDEELSGTDGDRWGGDSE